MVAGALGFERAKGLREAEPSGTGDANLSTGLVSHRPGVFVYLSSRTL